MGEIVKVTYPDGRVGEMYFGGGGGGGPRAGHGATGGGSAIGDVIMLGAGGGGGVGVPAREPRPEPPVHEEEQVALIEVRIKAGSRLTPEAVMDAAEAELGPWCTDLDWRIVTRPDLT